MKVAIILSGGMDSATLLFELLHEPKIKEIHCITFDYGQRHRRELTAAKELIEYAHIHYKNKQVYRNVLPIQILGKLAIGSSQTDSKIEVPEGHYTDENMKKTVVPNRNMVMLSLAASYCFARNIPELYYGAHAGDHAIYPDCRPQFIQAMQAVLDQADWNKVRLVTPYDGVDKGDIAILGKGLKVPYHLTWTCYKGGTKACGKCGACSERLQAFDKAALTDPIEYVSEANNV